jgi:SAM-dependent methyltransferase
LLENESERPAPEPTQGRDWDIIYRESTPPWETGKPSGELVRLVDEKVIKPCRTLEIGCGTGANAIFLAKRGFEMTAVDSSPTAIERARTRAERANALLRIVLDDVYSFAKHAETFDLVLDVGFYHFARQDSLTEFLDLLWHVTRPGVHYLTLAGAKGEPLEGGPPQVSEDDIRWELGRLFEPVQVRPFRFESLSRPEGFPGWSCLMRRPVVRK